MSKIILGYDQNGRAIVPPKPGRVTTACMVYCKVCSKVIAGSGGPKQGACCPEHAPKRMLLDKRYSAEELSDLSRDISEVFDESFTPEVAGIPVDEHGFSRGQFHVQIVWEKEA